MRRLNTLTVVAGITVLAASVAGIQKESMEAPVKRVTVYPDQAHVTRVGSMELAAGDHVIVIENLPDGAIDASFQVSATGEPGITLYGLTHTTHEHLEAPVRRVAELERELDSVVTNRKAVLVDDLEGLKQLKEFLSALSRGATSDAADQVARGGINVAQWSAAYDFVSEKSSLLNDSIRKTNQGLEDVDSRLGLIKSELRKLSTVNQRRTKTVSVELRLEQAGEIELSLEYLVLGAMWTPLYDARIGDNPDVVEFTYKAEVNQKTGEDWTDVDLKLSTAQPSFGAGPGELSPWFLSEMSSSGGSHFAGPTGQIRGRLTDMETDEPVIGASVVVLGTNQGAMSDIYGDFQILRVTPGVYTLRISSVGFKTNEVTNVPVTAGTTFNLDRQLAAKDANDLDKTITVVGTQDILDKFVVDSRVSIGQETIQQRPVQKVDNLLAQVQGVVATADGKVYSRGGRASDVEAIVTTSALGSGAYPIVFQIKGTESIASGGEAVRVTVSNWTLTGKAKLISRPINRQGAFRLTTLKNQDKAPLMPGRVAIFAGAHFLGHTQVEQLIAPGEEFELPFGVDNHVTVKREIVAFMRTVKGHNVETQQTIQITLTNLDSMSRTIELEESLPISRDSRIKVKLGDIVPEPQPGNNEGAPKWSLVLEPGKEMKILIPYQLSYPSSMRVAGL